MNLSLTKRFAKFRQWRLLIVAASALLFTLPTLAETHYVIAGDKFLVRGCAHPINFRQTVGYDAGNGILHFEYVWESDSGSLLDLDQVWVGEHVDYPNGGAPPDPPFHNWAPFPDPTVINVSGSVGGFDDNHSHCAANESMTAGPAASYIGTQNYRYHCNRCMPTGNQSDLNWGTVLSGPIDISRYVEENNGVWQYRIRKSGVEATQALPYP